MQYITITLPDGTTQELKKGITGQEIAQNISKSLAKEAIAIEVNQELQDLSLPINSESKINIITSRQNKGLEILRHDAAHLMAQAVQQLYPDVQVTIGPAIEDGFYYDFAKKTPFSLEDLEKIEQKMHELSRENFPILRHQWPRDKAIEFFKSKGQQYKAEIIADIPEQETITLYSQGDFIDLCRGPHAPSTGFVKHFKLTKTSGAYWRGDSSNEMLYRIYGTVWPSKKELDLYLHRLEEAKKRDHRKIAKELDLFHLSPSAPGMVFWHPAGRTIYSIMEQYIRSKLKEHDYLEVKTPILADQNLWEKSGHWEKFADNMFTSTIEKKNYALKPMNCPCHVEIFKQGIKSYKDLPLRMSEFGTCHRNESSGSLHGLMRVRSFVQDDAHIFCQPEHIKSETLGFYKMLKEVYKDFGFEEISIKFSDRPKIRAGSDAVWDKSEAALRDVINEAGIDWELNSGEGAFYGPKLEFVLKDAVGRSWQCGTLQVDFITPERLGASFIDKDGKKKTPIILHRAIIGTFERFMGILLEQYAGRLPVWLAPTQVTVCSITSESNDYANEIFNQLKDAKIRCSLDISPEKINYKVRAANLKKVHFIACAGAREKESGTISLRTHGQKEQKIIKVQDLIDMILQQNAKYLK